MSASSLLSFFSTPCWMCGTCDDVVPRRGAESQSPYAPQSKALPLAHLVEPVHVQLPHKGPEVRMLEEAGQQLASEPVGRGDWRKSTRLARVGSIRSICDAPKNESPSSLHRIRSSVSGSDTMLFEFREGITSEGVVRGGIASWIAGSVRTSLKKLLPSFHRNNRPARRVQAAFASHLRASTPPAKDNTSSGRVALLLTCTACSRTQGQPAGSPCWALSGAPRPGP